MVFGMHCAAQRVRPMSAAAIPTGAPHEPGLLSLAAHTLPLCLQDLLRHKRQIATFRPVVVKIIGHAAASILLAEFTRVDELVNSAIIIRLQELSKALHGNAIGQTSSTTTSLIALTRQENQHGAIPKRVVDVQNQLLQQIQINACLINSRQVPSRACRVSCISCRIIIRICWRSICIFVAPPRLLPAYRKA